MVNDAQTLVSLLYKRVKLVGRKTLDTVGKQYFNTDCRPSGLVVPWNAARGDFVS